MPDICGKIATELKNQYVLGYRSTNTAKEGAWRGLNVKVRSPKGSNLSTLGVMLRKGDYAPTGDSVADRK
jgi:hypothetical protein